MVVSLIIWLFWLTLGVRSVMIKITPQVTTTSGKLLGRSVNTQFGPVDQYLGIPYAKAPLGNLRFQPPRPIDKEEAHITRDAFKFGPICLQPPHIKEVISPLLQTSNSGQSTASEDCLTLNIYKPAGKQLNILPVMVWLPGEGFDYADASQFDGTFLATLGNVIVVTINYRVSVFGFLSTLTPEAPGNIGFLDQRLALQWIQENICQFHGNPNKITFFGRFTGSMSISAHMVSPLNKGDNQLFHRVILQSGIATGQWIFDRDPLNATKQLAEATDCDFTALDTMVSCLQQIPAETLLTKSFVIPQRWRPIIDGHFLTEDPLSSVSKGQHAAVDVILGVNSDEGSLCLLSLFAQKSAFYQKILDGKLTDEDLSYLIKSGLKDFVKKTDHSLNKLVAHEYQHFKNTSLRDRYMDFCGNMYIKTQTEEFARQLVKNGNSKVFMYEFSHRPSFSIHPDFIQAAHGDDVLFTFGLVHQLSHVRSEEANLTKRVIAAFSNFANTGNPNPIDDEVRLQWPEFSSSKHLILEFSVNMTEDSIRHSKYEKDVAFWYNVVNWLKDDTFATLTSLSVLNNKSSKISILGSNMRVKMVENILVGLIIAVVILSVGLLTSLRYIFVHHKYKQFFNV